MNVKLKNRILFYSLLLITLLYLLIFFIYNGSSQAVFFDDYIYSIVIPSSNGIFDCLKFSYGHGGGYIGFLLSKFFTYKLPVLLSIHPADFNTANLIIKGFFTLITLGFISKFSQIFYKNKAIYSFILFFIGCYYINIFYSYASSVVIINYHYFRYSFSLIFFSIFVYYICKNVLSSASKANDKKFMGNKSKFGLYSAIISGYIAGTSSEIVFITSFIFIMLLLLYQFFLFLISKIKNDVGFYKNNRLNINKYFFIPVIVFCIAMYLFTTSDGFNQVSKERGVESFLFNLREIKDFLINYVNLYIIKHIVYWCSFVVVFISSAIFSFKRKELKKILIPILLEISILGSIFSLIACGKTYYSFNQYWLFHPNIIFIYSMMILIPFFMYISYLFKIIMFEDKKIGLKTIIFLILFSSVINLYSTIKVITDSKMGPVYYCITHSKQDAYKLEKIFRFYNLKNQIPYIPYPIETRTLFKCTMPIVQKEECYDMTDNWDNYRMFWAIYYDGIYFKDGKTSKKYCVSEKAFEKYYQAGGIFTEEELKEIKFSRLLDKDFVLNNNK